jgi:hypothetical protein
MAVGAIALVLAGATSAASAAPRAASVPQSFGQFAGYESSFPATNGTLVAEVTVADFTCPNDYGDMGAVVEFLPGGEYGVIGYSCHSEQPVVDAEVIGARHAKSATVLPGDVLRFVLTSAAGADHDNISVTATDLSQKGIDLKVEGPDSVVPTSVEVALQGNAPPGIPTFKPMEFEDVKFNGTALGSLPDLEQLVMVGKNKLPMVHTDNLIESGKGFWLNWKRKF